jgi:hypothetical protein
VRIELKLTGSADATVTLLSARADTDRVRADGQSISFHFDGDEAARAALLQELVRNDLGVSAFTPRDSGIESVLMEVIRAGGA